MGSRTQSRWTAENRVTSLCRPRTDKEIERERKRFLTRCLSEAGGIPKNGRESRDAATRS